MLNARDQWNLIMTWMAHLHVDTKASLTAAALSCRGIKAPVAFLIFPHTIQAVPLREPNEDTTLNTLRTRVQHGYAEGLIEIREATIRGQLDGTNELRPFQTLLIIARGGHACPTRWKLIAQGFLRKKKEIIVYEPDNH